MLNLFQHLTKAILIQIPKPAYRQAGKLGMTNSFNHFEMTTSYLMIPFE
jgi:hypothetical protein